MKNQEQEKGKTFLIEQIIGYVPNSVVIKTVLKKATGNVTVLSFASGEVQSENVSPFDTLIQVIDGKAEITIDDQTYDLDSGESIIIPAHSRNAIRANLRFKMVSTVIKSGYEEVSI